MKATIFLILASLGNVAAQDLPPPAYEEIKPSGEYFVSPSGRATNDGTEASPWPSVEIALGNVGGGNIITLLPGVYPAGVTIDLSGRLAFPTVIRSQHKWAAIIQGSPSHGIYTADGVTNVVIDGLQVANSRIDGIKVGSYVTVRNCWVHHSHEQGISAHVTRSTILERNLIEFNGTDQVFHHGIYISGTNDIVCCNVIRWNKTYGCQIYYDPPASSAECQFYNNLVYGNRNALTIWSPSGQTNYVFNNTLLSTNYVLIADYGRLCVTNNILVGAKRGRLISLEDGAQVLCDYNLTTIYCKARGPHDVLTGNPGFVNPHGGLFWLKPSSYARGIASRSLAHSVNFFGLPSPSMSDVGAFQYSPAYVLDSRVLDPSPACPDYWVTLF